MAAVNGLDFVALQVRDLERSRAFYTDLLGLPLADESPPDAVVFATALWLGADDAPALHNRLAEAGVTITQPPFEGPFGVQFAFLDPDGYPITIHEPA